MKLGLRFEWSPELREMPQFCREMRISAHAHPVTLRHAVFPNDSLRRIVPGWMQRPFAFPPGIWVAPRWIRKSLVAWGVQG